MTFPPDEFGRLDVERCVPKIHKNLEKASEMSLIKSIDQWDFINSLRPTEKRDAICLVHGDLHSMQILVDRNQISGIIDWGDTHIGDPACDLSIVSMLFPPESRKEFEKIYGKVNKKTWALARMKALNTTLYLLLYAYDQKNQKLLHESLTALEFLKNA